MLISRVLTVMSLFSHNTSIVNSIVVHSWWDGQCLDKWFNTSSKDVPGSFGWLFVLAFRNRYQKFQRFQGTEKKEEMVNRFLQETGFITP